MYYLFILISSVCFMSKTYVVISSCLTIVHLYLQRMYEIVKLLYNMYSLVVYLFLLKYFFSRLKIQGRKF